VGSLGRLHAAWRDDPRLGITIGEWRDDTAADRPIWQVATHFEIFVDRLGDELLAERRAFYEGLIASETAKSGPEDAFGAGVAGGMGVRRPEVPCGVRSGVRRRY
jgi:hypothetical protein